MSELSHLIPMDVKHLHDQGCPGIHCTPRWRQQLPHFRWTACDERTRVCCLAFGHTLNRIHAWVFLIWALARLRL
ncbi:MAG: hypothetical protein RMK79_05415 [Anaerolineae bacterium]|nr:hypothetical protein [Anaerolineae bacterium]